MYDGSSEKMSNIILSGVSSTAICSVSHLSNCGEHTSCCLFSWVVRIFNNISGTQILYWSVSEQKSSMGREKPGFSSRDCTVHLRDLIIGILRWLLFIFLDFFSFELFHCLNS